MDDLKGFKVKEILYYKNSIKFVFSKEYSPDRELELSLVKINGISQLILTENHIIKWRSGSLP